MRERPAINHDQIRRNAADAEAAEIVNGHLAARRMQRRVLLVCSVLAMTGIVLLAGAVLWSGHAGTFQPLIAPL